MAQMNRNLRQLVDNCFEEAQFDAAVSTLDLLRSPDHVPSPIHLLHLLILSLYPTTHPVNIDNPDEQPLNHAALLQQSPRKIVRQSKAHQVLIAPNAVHAATRALNAFLRTNGLSSFANALPYYPDSKSRSSSSSSTATTPAHNLELVEGPLYTHAIAIHSARSVWEVVKSGFTTRAAKAIPPPALPKTRTMKQKLARDASFNTDSPLTDPQPEDIKPVGEHAWLTLDFLVSLFEADARQTSSPKHSIFLLKQLPPPPFATQTRWDASEPLKVIFYALAQEDEKRQRIGSRLLVLLIDLTRTIYLNHPAFASAVVAQLSSFVPPSSFFCSSSSPPSSSRSTSQPSTPPPQPQTQPPHTPPSKKKRKLNPSPHSPQHQQQAPPPSTQSLAYIFSLLPSDTLARLMFRLTLCRKILLGLLSPDEVEEYDVSGSGVGDVNLNGLPPSPIKNVSVVDINAYMNPNANAMITSNSNSNTNANLNLNLNGIGTAKPRPRPKPILKRKKKAEDVEDDKKDELQQTEDKAKAPLPAHAHAHAPPTPSTPTPKAKPRSTVNANPNAPLTPVSASISTSVPVPLATPSTPTPTAAPQPAPAPTAAAVPPPPPAPIQRVPVPSLGELVRLLRIGLNFNGNGNGSVNGKGKEKEKEKDKMDVDEGKEEGKEGDELTKAMMRVRFELVMAWIGVVRRECEHEREVEEDKSKSKGKSNGKGKEKETEKEKTTMTTILDESNVKEELAKVFDEVFGCLEGVSQGQGQGAGQGGGQGGGAVGETNGVGMGMGMGAFYRRVLSAVVGV